jgi:hypothetical protein
MKRIGGAAVGVTVALAGRAGPVTDGGIDGD